MMAFQQNGEQRVAVQKPRIIRPMSHLEVYHSALHVLRHSCGTVVACRYSLPSHLVDQGSIDAVKDAFHRAMALTVLEHPMLRVGILHEDSALPSWVDLEAVDLGEHIDWKEIKSSDDYSACLRDQIRRQLDTWFTNVDSKPGWRISVLWPEESINTLDVIFCWNHTNFDGVAGKIFHQTLLRHLNRPKAAGDHLPLLKGAVLQLESVADRFPPPPETLVKIPVSLGFTLSTVWKELRPPFLVTNDVTQAAWCPIREEPYKTEFRTFSIDDATLKKVVGACRRHKTTVTGLLHALPLASLALQSSRDNAHIEGDVKTLHAITALDIRRFIPAKPQEHPWHVPENTMDNEMTLCDHTFDVDLVADIRSKAEGASSADGVMAQLEDIVWSAAARTRQDIQQKLDRGLNDDPMGLMKFVKDWRVQKKNQLKKPRVGAWGVSNLGTLDGKDEGEAEPGWGIERAVFQLSCEVTSPVFHISSISVKGKELCVDVSWQEGVINEAVGDRLAADMEAWMRFLGGRSS